MLELKIIKGVVIKCSILALVFLLMSVAGIAYTNKVII